MSIVKIIGKHQSPFGAMRVRFVSKRKGDAGLLDVAQQYLRAMALYNNFETRHYLKAIVNARKDFFVQLGEPKARQIEQQARAKGYLSADDKKTIEANSFPFKEVVDASKTVDDASPVARRRKTATSIVAAQKTRPLKSLLASPFASVPQIKVVGVYEPRNGRRVRVAYSAYGNGDHAIECIVRLYLRELAFHPTFESRHIRRAIVAARHALIQKVGEGKVRRCEKQIDPSELLTRAERSQIFGAAFAARIIKRTQL